MRPSVINVVIPRRRQYTQNKAGRNSYVNKRKKRSVRRAYLLILFQSCAKLLLQCCQSGGPEALLAEVKPQASEDAICTRRVFMMDISP
jgi:hypothetical protein